MSTGTKRLLSTAKLDAETFREMFAGTFDRWEVAGSVRRKRIEVGDIEHVVIPRFGEVDGGDLFGAKQTVNLLWRRMDELVAKGTLAKHVYQICDGTTQNRWGEKYRGVDFNGFNNEIFCATPENWGTVLLIRTGPADYSKNFVDRFLRGRLYRQQGGNLVHVQSGDVVPIRDEETYYRMAGLPFVKPEDRR